MSCFCCISHLLYLYSAFVYAGSPLQGGKKRAASGHQAGAGEHGGGAEENPAGGKVTSHSSMSRGLQIFE